MNMDNTKLEHIVQRLANEAIRYDDESPLDESLALQILHEELDESKWLPLPAGFKEEPDRIHASDPKPKKFNARVSHTFQDWSDAGYRINKGSKATSRDETGKATFKPNQVTLCGDIIVASYDSDRSNDEGPGGVPFEEWECY